MIDFVNVCTLFLFIFSFFVKNCIAFDLNILSNWSNNVKYETMLKECVHLFFLQVHFTEILVTESVILYLECPCYDYEKSEIIMVWINSKKWILKITQYSDATYLKGWSRVDVVLLRYHISWCYLFTIMRLTDFSITHDEDLQISEVIIRITDIILLQPGKLFIMHLFYPMFFNFVD